MESMSLSTSLEFESEVRSLNLKFESAALELVEQKSLELL